MSIDSEDSPLEEALRADLPTDEAAARLRRRLLAAGLAIGNGMAATTATAAAAGTTPGLLATAAAKVGAVSWGVKVGLAAAVAIPTVGLLSERSQPRPPLVATSVPAPAKAAPRPQEPVAAPPAPAAFAVEPEARVARAPSARTDAPAIARPDQNVPSEPSRPSQVSFDGGEPSTSGKASSTLAEETRLLDAAFVQISAGNRARAAELVREHETRFPKGLLVRERERAKARLREVFRGE